MPRKPSEDIVSIRVGKELLALIDAWRTRYPEPISRGVAIRWLVRMALGEKAGRAKVDAGSL